MHHSRLVLALLVPALLANSRATAADNFSFPFQLVDLQGATRDLSTNPAKATRVFVFLTTECPIANGNIPTLNQLHRDFARPGQIELFAVVADPFTTRQEAATHYREFKAHFPVLFDASNQLRDRLKPTHVPEAFAIDPTGALLYRGAIDNAWESPGKRRQVVTANYLADNLAALRAGKQPPLPKTKPVGCPVEYDHDKNTFTYTRDIAPNMHTRCAPCHNPLGSAFDLSTFATLSSQVDRILAKPCQGPPDTRRPLNAGELNRLKKWAATGKSQGDPADWPPVPTP